MALHAKIAPHKDKIMYLAAASGGVLAAALSFDIVTLDQVKGIPTWVIIAISAAGLYVFQKGFVEMRRKRKKMPSQQNVGGPNMNDLGFGAQQSAQAYVQPPSQQVAGQPVQPPPVNPASTQQSKEEDLFAEFKQH